MKKIFLYCFLSVLFLIKPENSIASHGVGADLTYICTGGNNYRFFFTLYRDCTGISVSNQYTISGTSTCGGSVNFIVNLDSTMEVVRTCSAFVTQCVSSASFILGLEVNYYHGDVTLPSQCDSWTFGIIPAICNRSPSLTNLFPNGPTYCLYVEATLNNALVQCNNSPRFFNLSSPFLCANNFQNYALNAYDPDNDSITYELYTPHSDAVTDVIYNPGLSATQPVTYSTDSTLFNPMSGLVRFAADGAQVTAIAVRVSEYRNGVLVGSVERDMQLIFENCTNNPPTASGMNGTTSFTTHICYDSLLTFQITTADLDMDSTFLTWDHGIPGGNMTISGGLFQTGIFSWQPDSSFISGNPYLFSVAVTDQSCPVNGLSIYTYQIYVDSCQIINGIHEEKNILEFSAVCLMESRNINFHYKLANPLPAVISLYDLSGREIKSVRFDRVQVVDSDLSIAGLSSGMYLLKLTTDNGFSKSLKISIQ